MGRGIGLKWFLLATLVVGVGGGLALKLLYEDPHTFRAGLSLVGYGGGLLAVVSAALLGVIRRVSAWESVRCAACSEPLRERAPAPELICPACQQTITSLSDLEFEPKPKRRWRLIGLLIASVLLPFGATVTSALVFPNGNLYAPLDNTRLIDQHFVNRVDHPWGWRALDRRLAAGRLSSEEVERVFEIVIAWIRSQKQAGNAMPHLAWGGSFLGSPRAHQLVDPVLESKLAREFSTVQVQVAAATTRGDGETHVQLNVAPWAPFAPNLFIGAFWDVESVVVDGEAVDWNRSGGDPSHLVIPADAGIDARSGDLEIEVRIEVGLVPAAGSTRAEPVHKPRETWGDPLQRWIETATWKRFR